jgi:hypothetical protein
MRILVCGDRNWMDYDLVRRTLDEYPVDEVVEGEARGADRCGRTAALVKGIRLVAMPAEWQLYGRAAGPIRNKAMLGTHPDLVLAFHDNIATSKGTANMLAQAQRAGVATRLVSHQVKGGA